jgi:hypothetical protein
MKLVLDVNDKLHILRRAIIRKWFVVKTGIVCNQYYAPNTVNNYISLN